MVLRGVAVAHLRMRVAIIGGGISGIAAASELQKHAEVVLFEARQRLGGHADTHNLLVDGQACAIDSGFTAFNRQSFPKFSAWLDSLGVVTQPARMSFGVSTGAAGLEYGTANLAALFAQRQNVASVRFLTMLADIARFYRDTKTRADHELAVASPDGSALTLGEYLTRENYRAGFIHDHLLPLCVALWNIPASKALEMPFVHVAAFLDANRMLRFGRKPDWELVRGGSNNYVAAFVSRFKGQLRLGERVTHVDRRPGFVTVATSAGNERFDQVVFACEANQALGLLDASATEKEVLGSVVYETNRSVVHSDASFMPSRRGAWSSWNVVADAGGPARVTSWVNSLQTMQRERQFFVSLNPVREPKQVWAERTYQRPLFTGDVRVAQSRRAEISGHNRSFFCGTYWGLGSHEDGFMSGLDIAAELSQKLRQAA